MKKPLHWNVSGQLCILGVDDDQVNLMVIEQLLGSEGWKILSATDGSEALNILHESSTWPDIIFLDYYLREGETGEEVCVQMREVFEGVDVPIVLCTALSDGAAAIQQALQAGATDYLLKPYEKNKMIDKIKKHAPGKLVAGTPVAPPPSSAAAAAPAPTEPKAVSSAPSVLDFCKSLDLEYCGMKLMDAGITMQDLKQMDDMKLRKAGIVVKSQRDKILQAVATA